MRSERGVIDMGETVSHGGPRTDTIRPEDPMQSRESLLDAFPDPGAIPADARLDGSVRMDGVLVGGKVIPWEGPFLDVTSPVRIRSGGGAPSPAVLGRFPLLTEEA